MTVKQHTPSGAQRSTSARIQSHTAKSSRSKGKDAASDKLTTKRPAKDKAAGGPRNLSAAEQRAADELTAERIQAILSDPKTPKGVAGKLQKLVNKLGEWATPYIDETPGFYARMFLASAEAVRAGNVIPTEDAAEAMTTFANVTLLAENREPQAYKVARRCTEIYADWLGRKKGRKYADGAHFFMEHVDAVLEGGDGLMPNPDSKYFVPLFVKAFNERGPRDRHVRKLLDLIKRVDEGADLNALRDEDERARAERSALYEAEELAKPEPKDKTSAEWRRWKLRRMKTALRGKDKDAATAAVKEFIGYAEGFLGQRRFVVSEVEELLPGLITFWQRARSKGKGKK